jgi:hypothetical protein
MKRGVGVAGNGVGLLNVQTSMRDSTALEDGLRIWDRVAKWACHLPEVFGGPLRDLPSLLIL